METGTGMLAGVWNIVDSLAVFNDSKGYLPMLGIGLVLMGFGLFKLNMYLGKPHCFYHGFYNLCWSPVSREIAGVTVLYRSFGFCLV